MVYSRSELWELLEETEVIVKVSKGYVINDVFSRFLGNYKKGFCMNFPDEFKGLSDTAIYNKVMEACKIPLMHRGDFSYMLRTMNAQALVELKQIFKTPEIDYNKFISKTRHYYKMGGSPKGFAKYLNEGVWEMIINSNENEAQRSKKGII